MIRALEKAFAVLSSRLRARWIVLVALTTLAGAGEVAAAAAVFGLVSSISDPSAFAQAAALIAAVFVGKNLVWAAAVFMRSHLIAASMTEVFEKTIERFLAEPFVRHAGRSSAELTNRATYAIDVTYRLVLGSAVIVISEALVIVGVAVVLVVRSPAAVLLALAVLGALTALALTWNHRIVARTSRESYEGQELILRRVTEIFGGLTEIRSFGREREFLDESRRAHESAMRAAKRQMTALALPRLIVETLFVCAAAIAMMLAAGSAGAALVPLLALYAYAGFRIVPAVNRIVFFIDEIRHGTHSVERLLEEGPASARTTSETDGSSAIELRGVSFAYGDEAALRDVSLVVRAGDRVAIAGETGSGKSTLLHLIAGLLEPSAGEIAVDRRRTAFVPQHPFLLDDSLRRNVAFGLPPDDERIAKVLHIAALDGLPLDTLVGERGVRLSGGERQRIAIARALYVQPEILLLDEATSALDVETETLVLTRLASITPRLTVVAATHRLHATGWFDRVLILSDGKLQVRVTAA